jgi:hypothetical protein
LKCSSEFIPSPSPDATVQQGVFLQLYPGSCSALGLVSAANLALLGLTDREICDAAGSNSQGDSAGDAGLTPRQDVTEAVRTIIAASGVDISAARAAVAAAKLPLPSLEVGDTGRERCDSTVSNTSEGSNQDSLAFADSFRLSDGRSSPVNHLQTFSIKPLSSEPTASNAALAAIAPPPAPATQVGALDGLLFFFFLFGDGVCSAVAAAWLTYDWIQLRIPVLFPHHGSSCSVRI